MMKSLHVALQVLFASLFCLVCYCYWNKDNNNINRTEHKRELGNDL